MTKKEIQNYIGVDYVVTKIIEDDNDLFAFYVSKEFEESGGNDKYALIGIGPFYLNKKNSEKRLLGAMEFHEEFSDRKIITDNTDLEEVAPNLDQIIERIRIRKHINGDEFELIMNYLNIDLYQISISSDDFVNETIESPNSDDIIKFINVFKKAELVFTQKSPNRIILKN